MDSPTCLITRNPNPWRINEVVIDVTLRITESF